jgi:hypothetical protein
MARVRTSPDLFRLIVGAPVGLSDLAAAEGALLQMYEAGALFSIDPASRALTGISRIG